MPATSTAAGVDQRTRIATCAPSMIRSRSPAGYAVLISRAHVPALPSAAAGPMKNTQSSTPAATATISPSTSAPRFDHACWRWKQRQRARADRHVAGQVADVAEVRVGRAVEGVLEQEPHDVAEQEACLSAEDQQPRRSLVLHPTHVNQNVAPSSTASEASQQMPAASGLPESEVRHQRERAGGSDHHRARRRTAEPVHAAVHRHGLTRLEDRAGQSAAVSGGRPRARPRGRAGPRPASTTPPRRRPPRRTPPPDRRARPGPRSRGTRGAPTG